MTAMMTRFSPTIDLEPLRRSFGSRLQENVLMANYTTARVGGPADGLLIAQSAEELREFVLKLWELDAPFHILGSGANVLVSDKGIRGLVLINRAHTVRIDAQSEPPSLWAESGASLSGAARQAALRGLSGLEWAAYIPGSIGGAVYGNAGAHGSNMQANLMLAEILHRKDGYQKWTVEQMQYEYRSSILKREISPAVILTARLRLSRSSVEEVQAKMFEFNQRRKSTQPPGANMGSMFKNPPGDYAGRLIEAVGLKGAQVGGAQISSMHANFFLNLGKASADDVFQLISLARQKVFDRFHIILDLEIECIGEF